MGNDLLRDKFGCYDVENRQYQGLRTKSWAFHQGYLYQTELQNVGQDKVRVITYEINPEEKQLKAYFQKLKMMGRYLLKGNIQLPLLCITQNLEECACRIQEKMNVKFYYQHYEILLSEEMKARERMRETFSEGEVWFIFYNVLNGLRQFQPFGQPSGNLTTKEVIMNNKGQLKIKNLLTSPFQTSRSSIFTNYFAPEQLQLMKALYNNQGVLRREDYKQKKINPSLCQIYSLAILIIVLITNYHHLTFYNPPFGVNQQNINNAIQKITNLGYSKLLTNIIKVMLANHKSRPFPEQIFQTFKPFEYELLHFKPFSFSLHSSEAKPGS